MTGAELRENIAKQLAIQTLEGESLAGRYVWDWVIKYDFVDEYLQKTDQILALIKKAGYLSPDEHQRLMEETKREEREEGGVIKGGER